MTLWCELPACTYQGLHDHPAVGAVPLEAAPGWSAICGEWSDPGLPPDDLDGDPRKCDTCWGTGSVPGTSCAWPDCNAHATRVECDECDGAGIITPMTTPAWEAYRERIRSGADRLVDLPDVSVRRGGIRFPQA